MLFNAFYAFLCFPMLVNALQCVFSCPSMLSDECQCFESFSKLFAGFFNAFSCFSLGFLCFSMLFQSSSMLFQSPSHQPSPIRPPPIRPSGPSLPFFPHWSVWGIPNKKRPLVRPFLQILTPRQMYRYSDHAGNDAYKIMSEVSKCKWT